MDTPRYCNLCNRNVIPRKKVNWLAVIFLAGIFYLPYYLWVKKQRCPICTGDNFGPARASEIGR